MKITKTILFGLAALAAAFSVAQAAQPVIWQATFTNNIPSQAYSLSNSIPVGNVVYQNNGTGTSSNPALSTNSVDTLQQSQITAYLWCTPWTTVGNTPNNGNYVFQTSVSPDGVTWAPGTNLTFSISGTNYQATSIPISTATFRYITVTNVLSSVTNAYCTNSANTGGMGLKFFFKGP